MPYVLEVFKIDNHGIQKDYMVLERLFSIEVSLMSTFQDYQ
jgi:hypothetical protein